LRWVDDLAGQEDRSCAGAEDGPILAELLHDFEEVVFLQEAEDSCRLAAGQDQAVQTGELVGLAHLDGLSAGFGERVCVSLSLIHI